MRGRFFLHLAGAVALATGLPGCESSFDPFEESDVAFSVFGYVDVAADTQFVRVASLQQRAFEDAPLEAVVTLEDLVRGQTTTLRDSIVVFANGAVVHNFWTDTQIDPASTYRLMVTGPGGRPASAEFETPPEFPDPELNSGLSPVSTPQNPPFLQALRFDGIENMADVRVIYQVSDPETVVSISYLDRLRRTEEGGLNVAFNAYADVQRAVNGEEGVGCPGLRSARVFAAAAEPDWPDFLGIDAETLALPGTVSNVEGGLGFVGGVLTWQANWGDLPIVFLLHQAGCES